MDKINDFDDFDKSKYDRILTLKLPQLNSFAFTLEKIMHLYRKFARRPNSLSKWKENHGIKRLPQRISRRLHTIERQPHNPKRQHWE